MVNERLFDDKMALISTSINERTVMLDKTRWANVFAWRELQILSAYLTAYKIPKGGTILHEGASELYLCLLVNGKADIYKMDSAQRDKLIASVNPGMTLGEMALIDGQPRSATAVAVEECMLLVMTKTNFQRLCDEAPRLAIKLYAYVANLLSQRLRQASARLADYLHDEGYLT